MATMNYEAVLRGVIDSMGLSSLPEEKQAELLGQMGEALVKRILVETFDRLGEKGVEDYEALVDGGADEGSIKRFFDDRIPGYDGIVEKIVADFKEEMRK